MTIFHTLVKGDGGQLTLQVGLLAQQVANGRLQLRVLAVSGVDVRLAVRPATRVDAKMSVKVRGCDVLYCADESEYRSFCASSCSDKNQSAQASKKANGTN